MIVQPLNELNDFYAEDDPWGYENNPFDKNRKGILLGELAKLSKPKNVLDIGCGHGFITRDLPGDHVIGVDISKPAIKQANKLSSRPNCKYVTGDIFELSKESLNNSEGFDLIIITGVVYPQYIGRAHSIVYDVVDGLLKEGGILVSVHIGEWYTARFPYILTKQITYGYREYQHYLEVYEKL